MLELVLYEYLEPLLRLFLSVLAGAIVGMERERGRRPAGLRTHTLVCLGACLVMVASLWFAKGSGFAGDPLRMSAQVISGIGFLGAGTIIKSDMGVRGLTTAASLWVVACIGLALGMGFYWGALIATGLTYAALALFKRMEDRMENLSGRLYVRIKSRENLTSQLIDTIAKAGGSVASFQVDREGEVMHVNLHVRMPRGRRMSEAVDALLSLEGVMLVNDQ